MPFKPGKSPSDLAKKVENDLKVIAGPKLERALSVVAYAIGGRADMYVPIDTSALLNSRQVNIIDTEGGYRAIIGYYQSYALPLHSPKPGGKMDGWKPRIPGTPGKPRGGYNADAKQGWILAAVEELDVKDIFKRALEE